MSESSFYSNTGTTSASISSINTLSNSATASKDAAAASATASASSATASEVSNAASLVSKNAAAASASTASTKADLATTNGAAQVTLAAAQVALATTQAGLATSNGAAQVALATTQAGLATTNGAAQVALATTQAGLATSNGAAQVVLATAQKTLAAQQVTLATAQTTAATAQVALATTQAGNSATSATASSNSATASSNSASTASTKASEAAASAVSAAASLDLFTDQYLGAHSSNPTTDGDGDALTVGDLYYDTTGGNMKYYNGSAWVSAFVSASGMAALSGSTFTGNITVPNLILVGSGQVDGRDVSVDGTKLDGIAASANNYVHPNHSGEVTSTADGATVIADNIVDEANLKISNTPTNGYALTAQSGNSGGLTWAATADTTYSVGDNGLTQKNFTTALKTKLDGIATSATNFTSANAISAVTGSNLDMGSNNVTTTGKMLFANMYSAVGDLPSASTYHGMFAHVHATGLAYYAHGGAWISLAKTSELASVGDGGLSEINFTSADHSKLNAIEASSDVTDTVNVTAAGALMDSEVTNLAQVKAFASSDYATAAQGTLASNALPKAGGTLTGNISHAGDLTLDVAGNIVLDADGGGIYFKDAGTSIGFFQNDGGDFRMLSSVVDKDIKFLGNDNGATITALTLDMSAAGAATFNNDVTAFSDERLKSNITTIPDALSKVSEMRGVHYVRDATGKDSSGVIAQEMQKVAPELVLTADDEMGTLSVNYGNITGYLIEAIKELKAEIEELKASK